MCPIALRADFPNFEHGPRGSCDNYKLGVCFFEDGAALDPHVVELLSLTRCLRVIGNTEPPAHEAGGACLFSALWGCR